MGLEYALEIWSYICTQTISVTFGNQMLSVSIKEKKS